MRKIIKYGILCFCVICVLFIFSIPIVNNYTAKSVANHLKHIPLPENTKLVESIYGAGKYVGNGNGMQYLGCILISSDLTKEEIQQYYSIYAVNEWDCLVEEQNGQDIAFIEYGSLSFNSNMENGKYYIVYSWGRGLEIYSELDIRGH